MVSKHLQPHALWGIYLGFSDAPHAIKGHKVWLPTLDHIIVTRDIHFSELAQLGVETAPPEHQVLVGNSELHQSYTWLPISDIVDNAVPEDATPLSLPPYSRQQEPRPNSSSSSDSSSYGCDWDRMMSGIGDASEIVMDLDTITADLHAELDKVPSERGTIQQTPTHTNIQETVSLLRTPCSDAIKDVYNGVSVLGSTHTKLLDPLDLFGYTAFAAMCSNTQAPTLGNHHLDCMAFVATVMDGTVLIASGQQLQSTDSILLEPLSLNEDRACDDWGKREEAMTNEMASMHKMSIFELADIPADGKLIGIHWVYKLKLNAQC